MKNLKLIRKMWLFPFLLSSMVLIPGLSTADETPSDEANKKEWVSPFFSPKVGNLYFLGGVGFNDLDNLNNRLDDAGYEELNTPVLSLGVGTDLSIGRLIIGGEWQWLRNVGTEATRGDVRADISAKYWLFRMGFDVAKWRGLRVYPLLGIGTGVNKFTVSTESGASFDNVLDNPTRDVRMTQRGLLLDASLGIDYRFKVRETEYKSSFFTVGLRGGYLFAPYSTGWETASAEITNGPDLITSGPTAQILIGFSGERKKSWWHKSKHHKK